MISIFGTFMLYMVNYDFFYYVDFDELLETIEYYSFFILAFTIMIGGILLLTDTTAGGILAIICAFVFIGWAIKDLIIEIRDDAPFGFIGGLDEFHWFLGQILLPILIVIGGILGLRSEMRELN